MFAPDLSQQPLHKRDSRSHKTNSGSTHVRRLELDVDEDLLGVFGFAAAAARQRAARLQFAGKVVLHPLVPRQRLALLSLLLAERPHLGPELVRLVVLLRFELVQTWKMSLFESE